MTSPRLRVRWSRQDPSDPKPIRPGDVAIVAGSCALKCKDLKTLKEKKFFGGFHESLKVMVFPRCLLLTWPLGLHTLPLPKQLPLVLP